MSFTGFVCCVSTASIPQIGENVMLGEKFEQSVSQGEGGGYREALTGEGEVTIVVAGVGSPCQAVVSITGLYKNI